MHNNEENEIIRIYKDDRFLELLGRQMPFLDSEEINFVLSNITVDENGRTMDDIRADKIRVYEAVNQILITEFQGNEVAKRQVAINNFMIQVWMEAIQASKEENVA